MNLRSRIFKKSWQSSDPQVRAAAVRDEHNAELEHELPRLAEHDESALVRLAALKRLHSEPFWLDARLRDSDSEIVRTADQYLSREIFKTDRSDMESARLEWLETITDGSLIRRIAAEAPSIALRRAALGKIASPGFLGDCYVAESDQQLAAEILERIDQTSTLERVIQAARRTSKRRAQAAAERLETLEIAAGRATAGKTASQKLVDQAERLARGEVSGDRALARDELQALWDAVTDHPEDLTKRFQGALRIVDAALRRTSDSARIEAETQATPAQPEPAPEDPDPGLAASADFIRSTIRQGNKVEPAELLANWDRAWNQLTAVTSADETLKKEILPLLRELQAQVQIKADAARSKTPAAAKPATDAAGHDFEARLDTIAETLEGGDIGKAHGQIRSLRRDFDRLPPRQRPRAAGGRLQRMEGRLKEMRNWQHWSNNKIRDELVQSVEQLSANDQHPDAVTAALKAARSEWKRLEALEVLPGDKRRFAAPPGQWRRFQEACKAAFESAKPYFEKREQVQQQNLETLQAFVEAGTAAAGDEAKDVKVLLGFLRKARQAIRRMDDLPPKSRGASAASLRELMNVLSASLDQRFDAVEASKRRLVAEAKALAHEKDLKAAADKAKALQSQWQKAGTGRRKVEQELWNAFREPIDPIFNALKGEQDQRHQADRQAHAELEAMCEQVEALAQLPDEELESARGRLSGLIDAWSQLDSRPNRLNRRFEQAEQRFEKRLADLVQRQRDRSRNQTLALAESIQALWEKRCGNTEGDLGAEIAPGESGTAETEPLLALARRIADPAFKPLELENRAEENAATARQIVVEMEFLSGLDTPPEDQRLRMDYQVQRLARRMTERGDQPDLASELNELQQRWLQSLPHPPQQHASLKPRFERARTVIEQMTGQG
ncbi:MAG: DUF349 domain-containing protein [Wenzhouxiangella sp.]|nr:MAG: DUF349 domain-containing protein [Wenzhouxiangella sp.]